MVFMFGGSVMWGWPVRDAFTIPSLIATRLGRLGYVDVEVINQAQVGFDLAQNHATLVLELRQERAPAVAVFLDGNNDIGVGFQSGQVGRILNQDFFGRRFAQTGLSTDAWALLRHSALVRRVTQSGDVGARGSSSTCGRVASSYGRQVRIIEAVARVSGFEPVFLWQPMLATTGKRLSAWEAGLSSFPGWQPMVQLCSAAVDSLLADRRGKTFFNLSGLFDGDSTAAFLDDYGHLTERANGIVADYVASQLAVRLGPPPGTPPP
jgi:hypothetical protein